MTNCETCDQIGPQLPWDQPGLELHRALHEFWAPILKIATRIIERLTP